VRLGVGAALVDGVLVDGDVEVEDGQIAAVGVQPAGSGIAVPGFVDAHINGIAGIDFLTADPDGHRRAGEALAATGVVAYQPTLVSSPPEAYAGPIAAVAAVAEGRAAGLPVPIGVHLEGPFLSPSWPGAHDPERLLAPDPALAARLCDLGPVTTMTLAPELPGGLALVGALVARGVVVSCGHSDADAAAAHAAFDRGATAITHVHNAHRRWRARDPGLAGVAIARDDVWVQAIVDDVHLAPESARGVFLAAGSRCCLVTDAIEAAGQGPGEYRLGDRPVRVEDGAARLPDGTLAGSVLTMDAALRNVVSGGASLVEAVHAASAAPARMLGRDDLGVLRVGAPAHVTVLDDELAVTRTVIGGVEAFAASSA
jgi:N-acetylglucosamine-6-phosphate deacetylase